MLAIAIAFVFVLGLIIATIINHRFFPHIIVERIVEENKNTTRNGVYLTNKQFIELVEDITFLVPQSTIRIGNNKVFFTKRNGEIVILTTKEGWKYPTANARVCGVKATPAPAQDYPTYEVPDSPPGY